MNIISFPGLGLTFNIDSVAFSVLGREIKWYALIILTGIVLATVYGVLEGKRVGIDSDTVLDVLLIGLPSAIICARAYYVIFEWDYYKFHKDEIIQIWNGGIAIYGAIIGAVVAALIYCKVKKVYIPKFFDIGAVGLMIGQAVGRWGNFFNAEAHGGPTTLPWRMYIQSLGEAVHPTFLYESLWNVLGLILILLYRKRKKFEGEIFLIYISWYGVGRALIEGLRTDSLYIPNTDIRVSQLLAVITVLVSVTLIIYNRIKKKK